MRHLRDTPGSRGWHGLYESHSPSVLASQESTHALSSMLSNAHPVVVLPSIDNPEEYSLVPDDDTVSRVLEGISSRDSTVYKIEFCDGRQKHVSLESLISYENGNLALREFENPAQPTSEDSDSDIFQPKRCVATYYTIIDSEDELSSVPPKSYRRSTRTATTLRSTRRFAVQPNSSQLSESTESDEEGGGGRRKRRRITRAMSSNHRRSTRNNARDAIVDVDEDLSSSEDDLDLLQSDVLRRTRKRKRPRGPARQLAIEERNGIKFNSRNIGTRQSARSTRNQANMEELGLGEVYRDADDPQSAPKATGVREKFQNLPTKHEFPQRHCQQCDTCGLRGSESNGRLIYCQGCTLSYHKHCLGNRNSRDHLVTKVGEGDFVLQCRRCISTAKAKDSTAPEQSLCQHCRDIGPAARPFRKRKTALQEEKEREENDGKDPIVAVDVPLNDPKNVLFRCVSCWRAFHFHHLPSRAAFPSEDDDEDRIARARFKEYSDFTCLDCVNMKAKPSGLVAWRPVDPDLYIAGAAVEDVDEDLKEYLVKWEGMSHYQCEWMGGAWVWGVTSAAMRKAYMKRAAGPTMNTEDAIPEDYLRIDIILDVRFTSIVETRVEEIEKARIKEIDKALIKFKGLGYEDAVWEKVPTPEDGDRWVDLVKAYDDWVMGKYIRCPKAGILRTRLEKVHGTDFPTLEKKQQPEKLTGGELMKYQLEGINWLYYRWWLRSNAILADEMGLGKTIQIIGFLATMVFDHHCFPFLVVVPNGTVPNWRREIKQWAPALRVVTYHGSNQARSMAYKHEMYPDGAQELRCHIVVTSYEAASDDNSRKLLGGVTWQGLIVDEGQRLKSDKTQLYGILSALKIPFRLLLTGTPLQNNARELFNLLQFLDDSFDAAALELEYAELTKDNVPQLHELIRPFFLRRTKAQVLTFLPPMAQIVLPVSMSALQSKLYGSILSKNSDLVRALYDKDSRSTGKGDRANLSNILMQLRKCLSHPFAYSQEIEEMTTEPAISHRNLVEASAKLQLLELLLPKLKQRGHRVLIFSQFLSMLSIVEDFMDGLGLAYERLDGTISSMVKQKRIDAFNAPDSPLFAFLLSTRAGGVGINLATADTVIILDPDFNPHQDIQALSRAHRIGQKNKVLCFQLMTRASAEEKIVQIGRRKMALDHLLIEQMDNDDDTVVDVESILRFGAADILEGKTQEIRYDDASIEKLLDRSQIEETKSSEENTAETQFSYARVWANDSESLADSLGGSEDESKAPDPGVWDRILKEREQQAAIEAAARQEMLGRGRRARHNVDYATKERERRNTSPFRDGRGSSDSDTDFQAAERKSDADDSSEEEVDPNEVYDLFEQQNTPGSAQRASGGTIQPKQKPAKSVSQLATAAPQVTSSSVAFSMLPSGAAPPVPITGTRPLYTNSAAASRIPDFQAYRPGPAPDSVATPIPAALPTIPQIQLKAPIAAPAPAPIPAAYASKQGQFRRATIRWPEPGEITAEGDDTEPLVQCYVCSAFHRLGHCPLKLAGPEFCNLCGLAHFGVARSCPHVKSETQVREMLAALKQSPESKHLIELAKKYLTGVKGTLVQAKKQKLEKTAREADARKQQQQFQQQFQQQLQQQFHHNFRQFQQPGLQPLQPQSQPG